MKKVIYIVMLILLASFVSAAAPQDVWSGWTIDAADITLYNCSNINSSNLDLMNKSADVKAAVGINNEAWNDTSSAGEMEAKAVDYSAHDTGTISFWYNPNDCNVNNGLVLSVGVDGDSNNILFVRTLSSGTYTAQMKVGGSLKLNKYFTCYQNVWQNIVIRGNGTTIDIFNQGVLVNTTTDGSWYGDIASWTTGIVNLGGVTIGGYSGGDGAFDEVYIYNYALSDAEILELNSSFVSGGGAGGGGDTLNFSATLPATNTQFNNTLMNFNVTINSSTDFNCSLYINDTLNQTRNGITAGNNLFTDFNITYAFGTELDQTYYFNCSNSENTTVSSTKTFYIDSDLPDITADADFTAGTKVVYYEDNLTGWIYFYDPNVFSFNITINDLQAYNDTDMSGTNYNQTINWSTLGNASGTYQVYAEVCDGHTKKKLKKDWSVDKKTGELVYNIDSDFVSVAHKDKNKIKEVESYALDDRFQFEFEFKNDPDAQETFIVESNQAITIVSDTRYTGHLVIGSKYWLDFENDDTSIASVERINEYKVEVTLYNLVSKKQKFKSIGELNCDEEYYNYNIINWTSAFTDRVLSTQTTVFYLNVSANSSMVSSMNATLFYNDTSYLVSTPAIHSNVYSFNYSLTTPTISTDNVNKSFTWEINTDNSLYNISNNTQQIYRVNIDNCSNYSTMFVNYSILDEDTDAAQNGMLDYIFSFWKHSISQTFSGDTNNNTNVYGFCMYPAWANFTTNISIDYKTHSTSFTSRTYSINNFVVDNSTDQIILYLLGDPTEITFHVVDEADNDLIGILIRAYRYDVATNDETLVETQTTDEGGDAIFGLKRGTTEYRFNFYQNGVLKINTTRFKLFNTEYTYIIRDAYTSPLSEWLDIFRNTNVELINISNVVRLSYNTTSSVYDSVCLRITDGNHTFYNNCSTAVNNVFTYSLPTHNETYSAYAYANSSSGMWHELKSLSIDMRKNVLHQVFGGRTSIFLSLVVFLVISLLGLTFGLTPKQNTNTTVIMGCSALIMLFLFDLLAMTKMTMMGMISIGIIILIIINRK